jgi:alpha-beta hydrolase superfamily lysophospholipase
MVEETVHAPDGTPLFLRRFIAERETAVLVFLHGLGAHSGWYVDLGNELARQGVTSYAFDYPGHGQSGGDRGDLPQIEAVFNSLRVVLTLAQTERPGVPLFLGGLSLGGLLTLRWALRASRDANVDPISGYIAMSPPIADTYIPLWKKLVMFGVLAVRPTTLYPCPLGLHVPITKNARVQEIVENDVLALHAVTARTYYQILTVMIPVIVGAGRIRRPILLLQGGRDRVVNPASVRWFFRRLGSEQKTLRVYEDLGHDLKLEPEMPLVARDIVAWIAELTLRHGAPHESIAAH